MLMTYDELRALRIRQAEEAKKEPEEAPEAKAETPKGVVARKTQQTHKSEEKE